MLMRTVFIANIYKPVQDRPTLFFEIFKEWEPKVLVQETLKLFWSQLREQLRGTL
jgi:hypothetical protein